MAQENKKNDNNIKQTFVINIISRENATWQGTIHWAQTNKTTPFRSALEMLMLIENAVD